MGFWFWFGLWLALSVGAIATFALIGIGLRERAAKLNPELELAKSRIAEIKTLRERASSYLGPESDLGKDPALSMRKRLDFLGAREVKRKARERRLIEHLKHIEINESRFS